MATIARSARSVGLGAAIVLHALLLVLVGAALRERPRALKGEGPTVNVRLLPSPMPRTAPAEAAAAPRASARRHRQHATEARAIERPSLQEPDSSPQSAATPTEPPLLDSDATRRAISQAARAPSRAASSVQERLGREIARAAKGDCIKGEYAGAGMGLLSLPLWMAAELRNQCRR